MKNKKQQKKSAAPKSAASKSTELVRGRVIGHANGFGFLTPDDKTDDLFISAEQMYKVLHGDEVEAKIDGRRVEKGRKRSVKIIRLISRPEKPHAGQLIQQGQDWFIRPQDSRFGCDFEVHKGHLPRHPSGKISKLDHCWVIFNVISDELLNDLPHAKIVHILRENDEEISFTEQAIFSAGIPFIWPDDVSDTIKNAPQEVLEHERSSRLDLRKLPFVTIDGEDARDFDDAVFVEPYKNGSRLYVAIADVAHYIQRQTTVDNEAYKRATSVYFVDQVVPMLPEVYSNHICSLNPHQDRLVLVCEMHFDGQGNRTHYQFHEAVIHSHLRLTYTQVKNYLGDEKVDINDSVAVPQQAQIEDAKRLFELLLAQRTSRGALDLDTAENRIILDDKNQVEKVIPIYRNVAHRIIEEFMLAANVCAAEYIKEASPCGIYRVHEEPDPDRIETMRGVLAEFKLHVPGGDIPSAGELMQALQDPSMQPQWKNIVQNMILRSQKQAKYTSEASQHYALNFPLYTHFTSPIRRYPDLIVHRLLKSLIAKKKIPNQWCKDMAENADHCSVCERRAEEASREVETKLKLSYLSNHLGQAYQGVISGVTEFGLFVELEDVCTSGLVHVSNLGDDYFEYDQSRHVLRGRKDHRVFSMGMAVKVLIAQVNVDDKRLDLDLISSD